MIYKDRRYRTILKSISDDDMDNESIFEINSTTTITNNNNHLDHNKENYDDDDDNDGEEEEDMHDENDNNEEVDDSEDTDDFEDMDEEQFDDVYNDDDKDQDFIIGYQRKTKKKIIVFLQRKNHIDYNPIDININSHRKFIVSELQRLYEKHKDQRAKKKKIYKHFHQ